MTEMLTAECLDMYDVMLAIRSTMVGAPVISKTNAWDITETGITYGGTGVGVAYIRPKFGATVDDYTATVISGAGGGNATRVALTFTVETFTFAAAGRTVILSGGNNDWTADHGVVAGNFVQFRGTVSNDRNGKLYRVLTVTTTTATNDTVTLETTETVTDEAVTPTDAYRWHSGVVFNLRRDPAIANVDLGHFTSGRGAIFEDDDDEVRIQLNTTTNWAVSDTIDFDLVANALIAASEGWAEDEINISTPDDDFLVDVEGYWDGPGISGTEQINVLMRSISDKDDPHYNVEIRGADGYVVSSIFEEQPNVSPAVACLGSANTMNLWLTVSGDRIAGAFEAGASNFENFYAGFGDPLADANQHPRPMVIGGSSTNTTGQPSDADNQHSAYWDPVATSNATSPQRDSPSSCVIQWVDGDWFFVSNRGNTAYALARAGTARDVFWAPFGFDTSISEGIALGSLGNSTLVAEEPFFRRVRPATGDSHTLHPIILTMTDPQRASVMELQGIFFVTGFLADAGDTIADGSDDYVFMHNVSNFDQGQFVAIKLTGP